MNERFNTYQEEVVHIQHQNERIFSINLEVKVQISITSSEAQLHQVAIYPLVPSSGCLLQPIEGFIQPSNMIVPILDFEPQRLLHIHLFFYRTMQICGLHIHLMMFPSLRRSKGYDRSDGGISSHK